MLSKECDVIDLQLICLFNLTEILVQGQLIIQQNDIVNHCLHDKYC